MGVELSETVKVGGYADSRPASFRNSKQFVLIAGPCLLESEDLGMRVAETLVKLCDNLGIELVFKASLDKANRSSPDAPRGMGWHSALRALARIRGSFGVPVTTDVHETAQITDELVEVVDLIQIPALLARQTDLIVKAGATPRPVSIKKGQQMHASDMQGAVQKAGGRGKALVIERGNSWGYHDMIVDMRNLVELKSMRMPVVFDATHSAQTPGSMGHASGGNRYMVAPLARAAVAVGVAGIFIETHPDPDKAMSDGPVMIPLATMGPLLKRLVEIDQAVKGEAYS